MKKSLFWLLLAVLVVIVVLSLRNMNSSEQDGPWMQDEQDIPVWQSSKPDTDPFIPEWPLADVSDAEPVNFQDITGALIYSALEWTTLNWVRKTNNDAFPGTLDLQEGKIALRDGNVVAGAFVFDVDSLQAIGKSNDALTDYLKSEAYLDSENFPIAFFTVSNIGADRVSGVLTMRWVSKTISFPALTLVEDDTVRINADFSLDRTNWAAQLEDDLDPYLDVHLQWILKR